MALSYDDANDGVFTHLGKLVKFYTQFKTDANDLDADLDEILDAFQNADLDVAIDGLVSAYQRWKAEYSARRAELAAFALARLRDKDSVLDEIGAATTDQDEILRKLIETMDEDGETVVQSAANVPDPATADGDNAGGGKILTTKLLDGVTSPGSVNGVFFPAHVKYNGVDSELCAASQKFTFRVVADSFHDDVAEGSEEILWEGTLPDEQHGIGEDGSGYVATIQPVHASTANYVSNADFESFTGNIPDDWDLVSGAAGTNVLAAGSGEVAHGSDALLFQGGASAIEIKQDIPASNIVARKRYCLTVKLKQDSAVTGTTLTIKFEGDGYTAGTGEEISEDVAGLGSTYQLHNFFITMPAIIPSDFRLVIRWNGGSPGGSEKVYIDDLGLGPVYYGGGFGVVAVRDSNPFVREDRYELSVTNNEAGVFQTFFRRAFGVQLPSDGASPSISDGLATT